MRQAYCYLIKSMAFYWKKRISLALMPADFALLMIIAVFTAILLFRKEQGDREMLAYE